MREGYFTNPLLFWSDFIFSFIACHHYLLYFYWIQHYYSTSSYIPFENHFHQKITTNLEIEIKPYLLTRKMRIKILFSHLLWFSKNREKFASEIVPPVVCHWLHSTETFERFFSVSSILEVGRGGGGERSNLL